jgi:hypothetical protein
MEKTTDYRHHAFECRALAARATKEHRDMLLNMANTWEMLATEREENLRRQRRIDALNTGGLGL